MTSSQTELRMSPNPSTRISIMKRIRFCAGHRLLHHGGPCENLHGHNYVAEIHVTGEQVDAIGRIIDFSVVNRLFKSWIDQNWDHGMLVWQSDTAAIEALRSVQPNRVYVMPWNPTAENMARYLAENIGPDLLAQIPDYDVRLRKVVIWETENCCAEVTIGEPDPGDSESIGQAIHRVV